ncbi:hypothetical protein INT46_003281 [Mucor plumbeus]|uniref:Uncharacterized protein n=1 Tax=Mucor plumbeus TaxID=97098 RepID=A0A8H7QZX7_9FUNG|nr:hypothetical protein INT46_003281 [Mucor plumbeus]
MTDILYAFIGFIDVSRDGMYSLEINNLIKQLEEDTKRLDMADTYDSTYISHPSGCKDAPQLWEPTNKEEEYIDADNREVFHGVSGS